MYRYRIYGVILESEFELKVLIPVEDEHSPNSEDYAENVIKVSIRHIEEEVMQILNDHDREYYYIDFNTSAFWNKAGFYLIRDGKEILVQIKEGYDQETISPWILGFCLSIALLQKGIMTIHCSAVSFNDRGVLISGNSGAGKSSLTGKLLESGCKLMADDVAAIGVEDEQYLVYSAFPYQKLCSNEVEKKQLDKEELIYIDEDKDKYLVPAHSIFESEPQPLDHLFFIVKAPIDVLQIHKMVGFDSFMAVKTNLFLNSLGGSWQKDQRVINTCMKIASKCEVYMIVRPEDVDTLEEMRDRVMEIIQ